MRSYYLLPLLCLTLCAVAECETITTATAGLDCRPTAKLAGQTENSPTANGYYYYCCSDGGPAGYDEQSASDHCCTVPLRQGKCPGKCRKPRSKRSWGKGTPWPWTRPLPEPEPTFPWFVPLPRTPPPRPKP